jgi:hypothetical protein
MCPEVEEQELEQEQGLELVAVVAAVGVEESVGPSIHQPSPTLQRLVH